MMDEDILLTKSQCRKCGITFEIGEPRPHYGEYSQCPEGGCWRHFWSEASTWRGRSKDKAPVRMGMTPQQYRNWMQDSK